MDRIILAMLAGILAGFALLKAPLAGTFLASLTPITSLIGILSITIFSLFLIYKGVLAMIGK